MRRIVMRLRPRDLRFEHTMIIRINGTGQGIVEIRRRIAHRVKIRISGGLDVRRPRDFLRLEGGRHRRLLPPVDLVLPEIRGDCSVERQVVLQAGLRRAEQQRKRIIRPCTAEHRRIDRRAFAP